MVILKKLKCGCQFLSVQVFARAQSATCYKSCMSAVIVTMAQTLSLLDKYREMHNQNLGKSI